MSYRPITDIWFLARARLQGGRKYYGAYLGGFPERARVLIGCALDEPLLHVCGGMAKFYPHPRGFGAKDHTLDLDPSTEPDFCQDARKPFPKATGGVMLPWGGILMDPPYSEWHAAQYAAGAKAYPSPSLLMQNAMDALRVGRKAGLIHFSLPRCPKNAKFVAHIGIACGFGNAGRVFSVFEKVGAKA